MGAEEYELVCVCVCGENGRVFFGIVRRLSCRLNFETTMTKKLRNSWTCSSTDTISPYP
jgi:hypothetical protein